MVDGPAGPHAVGIGLYAVPGRTIAPIQDQLAHERNVFDERNTDFKENRWHVEPTLEGLGCAAHAGPVSALGHPVGLVVQIFLAPFTAQRDVEAGGGERRRQAVAAEIGRDMAGHHMLVRAAARRACLCQVIGHVFGDRAVLEDVPGHTVRVGTAQRRAAGDIPAHGVVDRIQGAVDPAGRQAVHEFAQRAHLGVLVRQIVAPDIGNLAPQPEHAAIRGVVQIILAITALDAAPADIHILDILLRQAVLATQGLKLLIGQKRIAAVQIPLPEERARGSNLGGGAVVHEHQFGIGLDVFVQVVMSKGAGGPARIGPLKVIRGRVVVGATVPVRELVSLDLIEERRPRIISGPDLAGAEVGKQALGDRARADALVKTGCQIATGVIPVAQENLSAVTPGRVGGDVAAIAQVFAQDERDVGQLAVRGGVVGNAIALAGDQFFQGAIVIIVLMLTELIIQLDTLEIVDQDEVDHPGDRIRTIGHRGAAGQDIDALEQRARNLVDILVAGPSPGRAGRHAAAVDQHQGAR